MLRRRGEDVIASDLHDWGYGIHGLDFFSREVESEARAIVTNPPYKGPNGEPLAEMFVRFALQLMAPHPDGLVAMLLRHEFDCAKTRLDLFEDPRFALKLTLTSRPRWVESGQGSPRHNFAFFVWLNDHEGPAELGYLRKPEVAE